MLRRSPLFGGKNRVTFSLPGHEPAGRVSVVGDFNAWEPGRHEMVRRRNGTRTVSVVLPPGEHRFRYLASDGSGSTTSPPTSSTPAAAWCG